MSKLFPVYDICNIDNSSAQRGLMIENFSSYLEKHYQQLHKPHRHSFYHLVLFTKGSGTHTIDFVTFPVKPGQIYFMIPGQVHSWHFEGEVDGYIVHFNESLFTTFLRDGQYLEQFSFFSGNSEDGVINLSAGVYTAAVGLFASIIREGQPLDLIRLRLLELFITVEQSSTTKTEKNIPLQKLSVVKNFRQLIDAKFRTLKLPKEYAELLHVTPNYLNALCQDLLGKTAGDLIRDRVTLEAKRLLVNADLTVSEIAYELNFADNSYFTRFFRKHTGVTPEEFRRKIPA